MDCADAAQAVGEIEPATGADLYLVLASSRTSLDAQRLRLLRKAYSLDAGQGAEALADFARSKEAPGKLRLDAVEAVSSTLGTRRTVQLYAAIVDDADSDTALAAARKAKARDLDAGQRLLGRVAGRTADSSFQTAAAQEAGGYGKQVLAEIADRNRSHTVRLTAAKALYTVDRSSGTAALWKLARKGKPGRVRIEAAFALPGSETVDALIVIAQDRAETEEIRVDAGMDVLKRNKKRGREMLSKLAEETRISSRTREKIHRLLDK